MIELKCRRCDTGLFKVEDIAQVGKLPLRLTCHICGIQYIVKPDEDGSPAVFYRKGSQKWRKMEIAGLKKTEPAPGPEVIGDEKEPAPGTEEPAGDEVEPAPAPSAEEPTEQPEQVAAEDLSAAVPLPSQTETTGESPGPATEGTAEEGQDALDDASVESVGLAPPTPRTAEEGE